MSGSDGIARQGVLAGIKIIELAGIGPGPFAAMMLADHGAEVIRIERPDARWKFRNIMHRSRRSVIVDLKRAEGIEVVKRLVETADGFIEGLRPGVVERLGLGPDTLLKLNPRLAYGRVTGWGQDGPLAQAAGHDLNYIGLTGALHMMGKADRPPPVPLNLIGDFGGGGMLLAFGMVSAILAARATGRGQVIDAAMTEGVSLLMSMYYGEGASADWPGERGHNMLGGAAPFYDSYETADGQFISLACIEPQFYAQMLERTGLSDDPDLTDQLDRSKWPSGKAKLAAVFKTRTRDEWCDVMEGSDACFAPVLAVREAHLHPHNQARGTFVEAFGLHQPAPAPRFSESGTRAPTLDERGADTDAVLAEAGFPVHEVERLREIGILGDQ
jgi:alpha-methylacyl-CoA racemase